MKDDIRAFDFDKEKETEDSRQRVILFTELNGDHDHVFTASKCDRLQGVILWIVLRVIVQSAHQYTSKYPKQMFIRLHSRFDHVHANATDKTSSM